MYYTRFVYSQEQAEHSQDQWGRTIETLAYHPAAAGPQRWKPSVVRRATPTSKLSRVLTWIMATTQRSF